MTAKHYTIIIFAILCGYSVINLFLGSNIKYNQKNVQIITHHEKSDSVRYEIMTPENSNVNPENLTVSIPGHLTLFHRNPAFLIWTALTVIMICVAFGAAPVFIMQIKTIKHDFDITTKDVTTAFVFSLLLLIVLTVSRINFQGYYGPELIVESFKVLFNHYWVLWVIVLLTLCLQIPALMTIFLIGQSATRIKLVDGSKKSVNKAVAELSKLSGSLNSALQMIAVIVVFSVLTSGSLRASILNEIKLEGFNLFPTEAVYVYGITFTLFLAIVYIPTHYLLNQSKLQLEKEIAEKTGDEKAAKEYFEKTSTTAAIINIKTALTVLAPLITSFLPEYLHFFK